MEHTITANGIRQGRSSGLVLSQLQIGLAAGCALVACLTAFGGGVIVGMWYKASEQVAPLHAVVSTSAPEKVAPSADAAGQLVSEQPVTFYKSLTGNQAAYVPLTFQSVAPPPPAQPAVAVNTLTKAVQPPETGAVALPREVTASSAKITPPSPSKAIAIPVTHGPKTETIAPAPRAAASTLQKNAKAAQAQTATPPAVAVASAGTKRAASLPTASQKPAARERQPAAEPTASRPMPATPTAPSKAAKPEDYSVQVGSFGSSDQAERLRTNLAQKGYPVRVQLSEVPGQGLRYRVRVGSYADRAAADQSAHHLTAQEQVQAIVAGKN